MNNYQIKLYCPECATILDAVAFTRVCCPDCKLIQVPACIAEQARIGFLSRLGGDGQ